MSIAESININVEFRGGAELLFGGIKEQKISLPQNDTLWTIKSLLCWLKDNLLKQNPDLFIKGNSVRPGILVIINETDWELLGELDYVLKNDDRVLFISTLHGG